MLGPPGAPGTGGLSPVIQGVNLAFEVGACQATPRRSLTARAGVIAGDVAGEAPVQVSEVGALVELHGPGADAYSLTFGELVRGEGDAHGAGADGEAAADEAGEVALAHIPVLVPEHRGAHVEGAKDGAVAEAFGRTSAGGGLDEGGGVLVALVLTFELRELRAGGFEVGEHGRGGSGVAGMKGRAGGVGGASRRARRSDLSHSVGAREAPGGSAALHADGGAASGTPEDQRQGLVWGISRAAAITHVVVAERRVSRGAHVGVRIGREDVLLVLDHAIGSLGAVRCSQAGVGPSSATSLTWSAAWSPVIPSWPQARVRQSTASAGFVRGISPRHWCTAGRSWHSPR